MDLFLNQVAPELTLAGLAPLTEDGVSDDHYREVVEFANDLVFTHDLEGNLTSVNRPVQAFTGYSREEALHLNLKDLLSPESFELARSTTEGKLGGGVQKPYEVTVRRKDGSRVVLEISSRLLFRMGRPAGVLAIARDVSERRRNEGHLRLLRSVVVNANDAVLIARGKPGDNLGGQIVYVNEAFNRMTGYPPEYAVGRTLRILFGSQTDRRQLDSVRHALEQGQSARVELVNYRKDGSAYWVDVNFVPITEEAGEFTHWMAVQRETTERKQAEELERDRTRTLEMVTRNEPLEEILAHIAKMVERQCPSLRCAIALREEADQVRVAPQEMASSWSFPILSGAGVTLGAFMISSRMPRQPLPEELDLISMVSRLAAIAIEQRQLADKLAYQAQHDALTGLPNRVLFEDRLQRALAQGQRQRWLVAVLFVDLDRFKQINDTLGHPVGNSLLQQVARRLEDCIRKTDTLARMGGDEFTVVLTELHDEQYATTVAQKLLDILQAPFQVDGHELFVTASIGISVYPKDGKDAATLQRNADKAMYRAKDQGKNNFHVFVPEINATAVESLEIENALRRALLNEEFQLRYQPQVNIDGSLAGLEALLVWNHSKLGVISPKRFIPVAEETGLIVPIGSWVLRQACRQGKAWQSVGHAPVKVSVNVSGRQFTRPGFADEVASTLKETELEARLLCLELTESVVMSNVEDSTRQMKRLRSLGVGISIDDFGTGYSSLSYLRSLPIDTLKIDRSFLEEIDARTNTLPLLTAIVALAHSLNLCVVAEGVETVQQLEALRQVGCDRVQGYLTGKPLSTEMATRLLVEPQERSFLFKPLPLDSAKKGIFRTFFATG